MEFNCNSSILFKTLNIFNWRQAYWLRGFSGTSENACQLKGYRIFLMKITGKKEEKQTNYIYIT
jgi:hypothetical protein